MAFRRRARFACALLLPFALPAPAGSQARGGNAPPAAPTSLPAVRTELVQLDVVVTGRDVQPVSDLDAADFQVLEDGKPQALSHFAVARRPGTTVSPPASPAAEPGAPAAPPEPSAARHRFFVLAVDDLHTAPGSMAEARKAMTRFLDEQLAEDDFVALVTTSGAVGVYQDLTRDRRALRRAIERVQSRYQRVEPGGTPYLSEYQAELIDRSDVDALRVAVQEILQTEDYLGEVGAREKAYAQARRMVFEIMARSGRALGAIEGVVRGLSPLPGRKVVVLVSDGFLVGLGAAENRAFDVRKIVDAATRAGVVLYALDTRGLLADVPGGGASFQGPGVLTAPGVRADLQTRGNEAQRQSLNALAEDTGGFLVRDTNDLGRGLARILHDNEVYYLLAYEPTNAARDGRFRHVEVRVPRRSGLRVRTRSGYFAPDDRKPAEAATSPQQLRERELGQALGSLFPLEGVPMRMSADFIDLPPSGTQAVIRARIDVSGVPFVPSGDRYDADLEIVGAVYDEDGRSVGDVSGEQAQLSLTEASYRRMMADGLTVQKTVALRPGRYQVRMAVREGSRSLLGSTSQWLEIPDTGARPLTLSSVFLLADAGAGATELRDVQVDRRFHTGQGLHYVVQVYGAPAAAATTAPAAATPAPASPAASPAGPQAVAPALAGATLQAQVWRQGRLVGVTPKHELSPVAGQPVAKWSERIALSGFATGDYELRVLVTARDGKQGAQRRVAFRVE
jgi:VWFA-related protein